MSAPEVTQTDRLSVVKHRDYHGLYYIKGAPFRISFWTYATDIDPVEGQRRLGFANALVDAWNTRQSSQADLRATIHQQAENAATAAKEYAANMEAMRAVNAELVEALGEVFADFGAVHSIAWTDKAGALLVKHGTRAKASPDAGEGA